MVLLKERMDSSGKVVGFEDLAERIGLESKLNHIEKVQ